MQALIKLPVKNNDEIIAFLTSDVIKETNKPVAREGYKEGYLTKRGKNFGGWKTRFFVLQGPQLEYYESVRCRIYRWRAISLIVFSISGVVNILERSTSPAPRLDASTGQQTDGNPTRRASIATPS